MPVTRLPCVLVALERERLSLHDALRIDATIPGPCRGFACSHQQRPVLVVETGVGAPCALAAVDWLLNRPTLGDCAYDPTFLVFAGFAGALNNSLHVGDVIHAVEVVDCHGASWPAGNRANLPNVRAGRLLTVDRFIGEPAEKLALGARHQALAVDMESAAFARRCTEAGVPWACLRAISDDVNVAFTAEVAGLVEDGRVKLGRVAALLARKPWLLPKLLRLGRQTKLASRRLAEAVIQFLACSSAG